MRSIDSTQLWSCSNRKKRKDRKKERFRKIKKGKERQIKKKKTSGGASKRLVQFGTLLPFQNLSGISDVYSFLSGPFYKMRNAMHKVNDLFKHRKQRKLKGSRNVFRDRIPPGSR